MGNRIYGCDDCLAVCPWNKFASTAREAKLKARADLNAPKLADLLKLDDAAFRKLFSGSPIKRIGRDRFIRNVFFQPSLQMPPPRLPGAHENDRAFGRFCSRDCAWNGHRANIRARSL
jgi:hypothetical protein